jgi:hypothetical protein
MTKQSSSSVDSQQHSKLHFAKISLEVEQCIEQESTITPIIIVTNSKSNKFRRYHQGIRKRRFSKFSSSLKRRLNIWSCTTFQKGYKGHIIYAVDKLLMIIESTILMNELCSGSFGRAAMKASMLETSRWSPKESSGEGQL